MLYYLIFINFISFLLYGIDKYKARKKKRRISEFSLLVFSVFGGALGSILGMIVFHHKTLKTKFWLINLIMLIIWLLFLIKK